ncbi:hypothetical protein [Pedobacter punctiformis]|uniref:Histone H1 n=1 Tax=Pedobacter punctiformis TaxID=3004097 RepID=A0ABT4L9J1_9SPHI|nr:hypothetical protein [Pedobacter sp. HCMS5-2]MCZ4244580.1 hypothetical protein [Pedobacter sp. HCMS5-2]
MKKKKKSQNRSGNKKLKKELTLKLITAFDEVINQYGEAKKSKKIVENFARQLAKKLSKKAVTSENKPAVDAPAILKGEVKADQPAVKEIKPKRLIKQKA